MLRIFRYCFFLFFFIIFFDHFASKTVCNSCILKTLSRAIKEAQNFDTLIVQGGLYQEDNIIIDKPLIIIGQNYPIFDGKSKVEIFTITADNVTLSGLKIINVGQDVLNDLAAIKVKNAQNFTLKNNILKNVYWGIYLEKAKKGVIKNNIIEGTLKKEFNTGNGIHLWSCSEILIQDNQISKTRDGIYFEFVDDTKIINNFSFDNLRYGLHFMFSNNDSYLSNRFENNGAGVAVMFSKNIIMHENIFIKNWGASSYGLLLKEINDAEITNNIFIKNTIAIHTEGSSRILYKNNLLKSNGWAVRILGACLNNIFQENDFIANTFELSYTGQLNDNIFDKNYWSAYTGYDIDKNGVGDIPYRPVKLFSYVVNQTKETIVLLRSLFIDLLNFSEKMSPIFTPENLIDKNPLMKPINNDRNKKY